MDEFQGQTVRWWESARCEMMCMAIICYLLHVVSCRMQMEPVVFLPRMQRDRMNLIMGGLESVPQLLNQVSFRRC